MLPSISKKTQTLLLILLILSLSILGMGSAVYIPAAKTIKEEVTTAYQVSLLRTKDRIESYFRQIDQSILQFEKLPFFETTSSPNKVENQFNLVAVRETMLRMQVSLDYVDNIVLYWTDSGKLMSTNQPITDYQKDYSEVLKAFEATGKDFSFLTLDVRSTPTTVLLRKLPVFKSNKSFYLIIHVNQRFFDDILGASSENRGNYFILDENKQLLQNRGTLSDSTVVEHIIPALSTANSQPAGYFIAQLPPSYSDWTYGFVISNEQLLHRIDRLRHIVFLFSGLLLLVGVFIAILSANRLWSGWKAIVSVLNESESSANPYRKNTDDQGHSVHIENAASLSSTDDEFAQIYHKVRHMKENRDELQGQIKELIPDIREAFIRKMLEKGIRTPEDREKLHTYQVPLGAGPYGCLCVEIDQYASMTEIYSEVDLYYFRYGLSRVMIEVIEEAGHGMISSMETCRFIGVLSLEGRSSGETRAALQHAANTIRMFVQDYFPFTVSIGISRMREDLAYLSLSVQEAEEALSHKLLAGPNQVIGVESLGDTSVSEDTAVFMKELHTDLLFAIRSRNQAMAYEYADKLTSLQHIKSLHAQRLQGQLIELVFSLFRGTGDLLGQPGNEPLLSDLLKLSTLEEWIDWIKRETIDVRIDAINQAHQAYIHKVSAQIRGYLEAHNEEDIRIELCCKALNLPVSIGKQALKEVNDKSFADLLLASRMDKAKNLLKETDIGIEEIASRLLYSSAQNFSRTFKKTVGIPPGQFRKESRE